MPVLEFQARPQLLELARRHSATIVPAALTWGAIMLVIGLFGRIMTFPIGHDEQIHVAAATLLFKEPLYRVLGYNHLPGLPLLLRTFYELTGSRHLLQAGRILIFLCWIATASIVWVIARRQTGEVRIAIVGILVLMAGALLGPPGMLVTNNLLPIPFALLGFHLFFVAVDGERVRPMPMFWSGVAIGFAVCLKINFVFIVLPFAAAAFTVPHGLVLRERLRLLLAPFVAGGIVGAVPALVPLISDPIGLYEHTVRYFTLGHLAYWQDSTAPKAMTLPAKLLVAESVWFGGSGMLAGFLVGVSGIFLARRKPEGLRSWPIVLVAALAVCGAVVSFAPTPAFPQYYEPPIPFLIVLFFLIYRQLDQPLRSKMKPIMLTVGGLALMIILPRLLVDLPSALRFSQWTGNRMSQEGQRIRAQLTAAGLQGKVATLAPIVVLEGELPVYREFAGGPFVYRVADYLPERERGHFVTTSPRELSGFLDRDPPAAIVTGFEPEFDPAFESYARSRGYVEAEGNGSDIHVFLRRGAANAPRIPLSRAATPADPSDDDADDEQLQS